MINLHYSQKNTPFVLASELHILLKPNISFVNWFQEMIQYGFVDGKDYVKLKYSVAEGVDEWSVHLEMAKVIALLQNSEIGRQLRSYLLAMEQQRQEGKMLTSGQIEALMDIADVLGLFSVQKYLESEHYAHFILESRSLQWWAYRAKLFGVSVTDLKAMIDNYAKKNDRPDLKYRNQRQALFYVDRLELIRQACIDLFKLMGRSDEYAINMGNLAKSMAKKMKIDVYNDLDITINFTSEQQNETITHIKNYKTTPTALSLFN